LTHSITFIPGFNNFTNKHHVAIRALWIQTAPSIKFVYNTINSSWLWKNSVRWNTRRKLTLWFTLL
jgi:hypothetical protein